MRFITRSSIPACFISLVALVAAARPVAAQQTSWSVSTAADLTTALAGAFNNNVSNPSLLNTITLTGSISGSSQWIVNANVNIVGNGYTINMQNADRAFFIAGGTVAMSNLTITNGSATGGFAISGGGAGAGLGGAIFVGSGTYFGGAQEGVATPPIVAQGVSVPNVLLSGITFSSNVAAGGYALSNVSGLVGYATGGGGGMGGSVGESGSDNDENGLGGGGFGNNATGGSMSAAGGPGAFVNISPLSGMNLSGGPGGNGSDGNGTAGGVNGGGGGMGGYSSDPFLLGHEGSGGGG
jgi:hypothetical protein